MKNSLTAGAVLLLTTTIASAGGIERTGNAYGVLFEDGDYVQLSLSHATPDVSGEYPIPLGGGSTENMSESYFSAGVALKYGITPDLDLALFINQPYGADANYTGGAYTGLFAEWNSTQVAALAKFKAAEGISVYGGVRAVQSEPTITIPTALTPPSSGEYTATTEPDTQFGYVIGAAYELPAIALRVSLTYENAMTHKFDTTEQNDGTTFAEGITEIELPQTVALDFQTGVAADTLLFGSIRWAEWSVWEVRPDGFAAATGGSRITGIDSDVTTYRIGLGRRINDELSVFGRVTFEDSNGDVASRLRPTDGTTSIGVGGSYTVENVKFTGGIEYALLGDATDASSVEFTDNSAIGLGLSIGYSF